MFNSKLYAMLKSFFYNFKLHTCATGFLFSIDIHQQSCKNAYKKNNHFKIKYFHVHCSQTKQAPKINNITSAISVYHKIRQIVLEKK